MHRALFLTSRTSSFFVQVTLVLPITASVSSSADPSSQCDECYPTCGNCTRLGTPCSLSQPSPTSDLSSPDQSLNIEDLRFLHHWHHASDEEDFAPFVDHAHVDKKQHYNALIEKSFRHPYVLHSLLGLSALHLLHEKRTPSCSSSLRPTISLP